MWPVMPNAIGECRPVTAVQKWPTTIRSEVDIRHANSAIAKDLILCVANINGVVNSEYQKICLNILNYAIITLQCGTRGVAKSGCIRRSRKRKVLLAYVPSRSSYKCAITLLA